MNQLLNLKKPTTDDQIKFVRQMQTDTVRVVKTSEMLEMLKAIEENLIAVKIWNELFAKKQQADADENHRATNLIIGVGERIDELVTALEESKNTIRAWHSVNEQDESKEKDAWDIYDRLAPEMVKLNHVIRKYREVSNG